MDLATPGKAEFRAKARAWLEQNKPRDFADRGFALAIDDDRQGPDRVAAQAL